MSLHYSYSIQHQCKKHFKYEKILYLTMKKIEQEILGREKKENFGNVHVQLFSAN